MVRNISVTPYKFWFKIKDNLCHREIEQEINQNVNNYSFPKYFELYSCITIQYLIFLMDS